MPFQNHQSNRQAWAGRLKAILGNRKREWAALGIPILSVAIFVADLFTPKGVADWAWYFVPLLLSANRSVRFSPYLLAAILSALTVVGGWLSPSGLQPDESIVSRCIGIVLLWLVARLISQYRHEFATAHKLSRTVEQSLTAVGISDQFGAIQYVNQQLSELTGYAAGEIAGKKLRALFGEMPPPEFDRVWAIVNAGTAWRGEFQKQRKTGEYIWVFASLTPLYDATGQITHFVARFQDLTARRRAEGALRRSEERYRQMFTSSRDALMTLEPPGWNFTSGNPACVEMFRAGDERRFVSTAPWELSPEFQPDGRPSSEAALVMIETALRRGSYFF